LKAAFNSLIPGHGRTGEIMHAPKCLISGAQRKSRLSQATLQNAWKAFLNALSVPSSDDPSMRWLAHTTEGADDMPAHIKAALTAVSLSIPVMNGRPALGTWQGIYLFEHRHGGHARRVAGQLSA
jgi:thiamine phosphate synthase YjbQ (UPF0047 family)